MRKQALCVLLCGLILVTSACASGSTPEQPTATAVAPAQPTATSLPAGTVLYQADWSQGLSQWQADSDWKVAQGQLDVTANALTQVIIPYRPSIPNYAIEVRLEIVQLRQEGGGGWTIFGQRQAGEDGFQASVLGVKAAKGRSFGSHGEAFIWLDPHSAMAPQSGRPIDYDPGFQWHTYTIEVQDNAARLRDNGVSIGYVSSVDANSMTNGPLGFSCQWLEVRISSIRILSL